MIGSPTVGRRTERAALAVSAHPSLEEPEALFEVRRRWALEEKPNPGPSIVKKESGSGKRTTR